MCWLILLGSRLWQDLRAFCATHRLGQGGGPGPSGTPGLPGELHLTGCVLARTGRVRVRARTHPVAHALRLSSATLTPGPMVELIETFFR